MSAGPALTDWLGPDALTAYATFLAVLVALFGPALARLFAEKRTSEEAEEAMRLALVYMYAVRVSLPIEKEELKIGYIWKLMNLNNVRRRHVEYCLTRPNLPKGMSEQLITVIQGLYEIRSAVDRQQTFLNRPEQERTGAAFRRERDASQGTIKAAIARVSGVEEAMRRKSRPDFAARLNQPKAIPQDSIVEL